MLQSERHMANGSPTESWAVDAWNQSGAKEASITLRTSSGAERDDRMIKVVIIDFHE